MPKAVKKLDGHLKIIVSVLSIVSSLAGAAYLANSYLDTLATKQQVNLIFTEIKIDIAESDSLRYEDMRDEKPLTLKQQARYDRIQSKMSRLEASRDAIIGLKP